MAYVTGSAVNMPGLVTAIFNACTANGWTANGSVLSKSGTAHVRIQEVSGSLTILGGTGVDGGNNLTGAGPQVSRITDFSPNANLSYPLTYHVHINTSPDEVYVVINYGVSYYQWIAFGKSDIPLPGTGHWYSGSVGPGVPYQGNAQITAIAGGGNGGTGIPSCALFWIDALQSAFGPAITSYVHHGLDGGGWSGQGSNSTVGGMANAINHIAPLVALSPNIWNGESILLPIPVMVGRASSMKSLVLQPKHSRYVRVDNYDPGQVISIGPDQWKIYPWLKKDMTARNGGSLATHTGTFGWAIRHTP